MSYRNIRVLSHTNKLLRAPPPGLLPPDTTDTSHLCSHIRLYNDKGSCSIREAVSLHFRGAKGRDRMGAAAWRLCKFSVSQKDTVHQISLTHIPSSVQHCSPGLETL